MSDRFMSTPCVKMTAPACVTWTCGVYLGLARKDTSEGPAISRPAADVILRSGGPDSSSQEISRARSISFMDYFLKNVLLICHTSFSRTNWSTQSALTLWKPADSPRNRSKNTGVVPPYERTCVPTVGKKDTV